MTEGLKLNIGAGSTHIPGYVPIDIKSGIQAFPLSYEDESVDEIRASHILEHFTFADAVTALTEWNRVLKPNGRIRISVPDVDKVATSSDVNRLFYLMGGQTDEHDIHRSAYDRNRLTEYLRATGFSGICEWESDGLDTSSHPISLNLEAVKSDQPELSQEIRINAYMTLPRYEAVVARSIIEGSLRQCGIGLATSQGVFWGQCMQRMFEDAVREDLDWILSIDSDSLFNADHVRTLLAIFAKNPQIDALAALQSRRGSKYPLMTIGGENERQLSNLDPFKVTTAHFGLTLIRVSALKEIPKPWFKTEPDAAGEYGDDRLDDDIWFWHQWRLAGKSIYVSPKVSIGHLEETVAVFDDNFNQTHEYIHEWRQKHLTIKQSVF